MPEVSVSAEVLQRQIADLKMAADEIGRTRRVIMSQYQQLGLQWNDVKYRTLGEIVNECNSSLRTIERQFLEGQKKLAGLYKAVLSYEAISLGTINTVGSHSLEQSVSVADDGGCFAGEAQDSQFYSDDTFGDELCFERFGANELCSRGNQYEEYLNFLENENDLVYTRYDCPQIEYVNARDIEGVTLHTREFSNPRGFWTRDGRDGYSRNAIMQMAAHLPEILQRLNSGENPDSIYHNPMLSGAVRSYFNEPVGVIRVGSFYVFQGEGRHRTLAAQSLDAVIPVSVIGDYTQSQPQRRLIRRM